jgi:hypothetical protein
MLGLAQPTVLLALNAGLTLWLALLVLRLAWRVHLLRESDSNGAPQPMVALTPNSADGGTHVIEHVHVRCIPKLPLQDAEKASALAQLRADVRERAAREGLQLGDAEHAVLADDLSCCRFLLSRRWDVAGAAAMLHDALAWRIHRAPPGVVTDLDSEDGRFLLSEGARGKVSN